MKKYLLVMVLVLFVLYGCHKNSGCQQPFTPEEIPELTADGYNTCEAIYKNYTYLICGSEANYPYWSHEGDTIKVCGYIYKGWNGNHLVPLFDSPDNQIGQHYLYIDMAGTFSDDFDISRKCYVKGMLYFNPHYTTGNYYIVPRIICDVQCIWFE